MGFRYWKCKEFDVLLKIASPSFLTQEWQITDWWLNKLKSKIVYDPGDWYCSGGLKLKVKKISLPYRNLVTCGSRNISCTLWAAPAKQRVSKWTDNISQIGFLFIKHFGPNYNKVYTKELFVSWYQKMKHIHVYLLNVNLI